MGQKLYVAMKVDPIVGVAWRAGTLTEEICWRAMEVTGLMDEFDESECREFVDRWMAQYRDGLARRRANLPFADGSEDSDRMHRRMIGRAEGN